MSQNRAAVHTRLLRASIQFSVTAFRGSPGHEKDGRKAGDGDYIVRKHNQITHGRTALIASRYNAAGTVKEALALADSASFRRVRCPTFKSAALNTFPLCYGLACTLPVGGTAHHSTWLHLPGVSAFIEKDGHRGQRGKTDRRDTRPEIRNLSEVPDGRATTSHSIERARSRYARRSSPPGDVVVHMLHCHWLVVCRTGTLFRCDGRRRAYHWSRGNSCRGWWRLREQLAPTV